MTVRRRDVASRRAYQYTVGSAAGGDVIRGTAITSSAWAKGTALGADDHLNGCTLALPGSAARPRQARGFTRRPNRRPLDRVATDVRLALLGTAAGPVMWRGRSGISTLITIGGRSYLVDAGIGSARRYREAGARWNQLSDVFITHMHSDHTLDLPHFLLVPWDLPTETYEAPVTVWGPGRHSRVPQAVNSVPTGNLVVNREHPMPGVEDFVANTFSSVFQGDINIRLRDEGRSDPRELIRARDIPVRGVDTDALDGPLVPSMSPFLVMEDNRVKVTATLVDHRLCFPAFAYRFDTDHGSIVISGDTCPSDNLIRLARDADLLLHEVIHLDRCIESLPADNGSVDELVEHWKHSHTLHTEVGRVARDAGAHMLALTHFAPGHIDMVSDAEWESGARRHYDGPFAAGKDLDIFGLRDRVVV